MPAPRRRAPLPAARGPPAARRHRTICKPTTTHALRESPIPAGTGFGQ
ncbi:hypothetical protein STRAU_5563 [Streptomyces aurantiacus JA 4570]|uniref:Uncharacterized protein n=1 Tax=Streptomyces aurantiacus JA 4570 TaxID=1286094 RepID=S4AIP4_9ACTN|nr:hypothetical protein STRAU_5563 [Streptomyces aurantiacus JA 4570]